MRNSITQQLDFMEITAKHLNGVESLLHALKNSDAIDPNELQDALHSIQYLVGSTAERISNHIQAMRETLGGNNA